MQKVARDVAAENEALRSLLAARDISRDEIEAYLMSVGFTSDTSSCPSQQGGRAVEQLRPLETPTAECPRKAEPSSHRRQEALEKTGGRDSVSFSPTSLSPSAVVSYSLPRIAPGTLSSRASSVNVAVISASRHAQPPSPRREPDQQQQQFDCGGELDVDGTAMPPLQAAYNFPPELDPRPSGPSTAMLETPCEEAAVILVQLCANIDSTLARVAMGCPRASDCFVKNTDLRQLMDEMV